MFNPLEKLGYELGFNKKGVHIFETRKPDYNYIQFYEERNTYRVIIGGSVDIYVAKAIVDILEELNNVLHKRN